MIKLLIFPLLGFLLGIGFVEITYRFILNNYLGVYFFTLPIKLIFCGLILYGFFLLGGFYGFLSGIGGFFLGFLFMILVRGFKDYGRFKDS